MEEPTMATQIHARGFLLTAALREAVEREATALERSRVPRRLRLLRLAVDERP
jgi:hypothetical protein